jgi:two-component sensor histidine kinase
MKSWRLSLGSLGSWSGWVIFWILLQRIIVALASDPNRTGNYSPLWLLIWFVSVLAMASFVLLALGLGLARAMKAKPRPLLNVTVATLAGVLGNVVTALMAFEFGLDHQELWAVRILGGALSTGFMFYTVNTLRASLVARTESIRKLTETENQLLGYRDSAKQVIADEIERLKDKTKATLLPEIEKIQELIFNKAHERSSIVEELKQLIQNDVRPLSKEVLEEAQTLSQARQLEGKAPILKPIRPNKYSLKLALKPVGGLPIYLAVFPMIEFLVIDHRSALRGLIGGIFAVLTMAIIKSLIPERYQVKNPAGLFLTVLACTVTIIPAYLVMWGEYGNIPEVLLSTFYLWLSVVGGNILLSYTRGVELNREQFEQNLIQYNAELSKEIALFEQKLALEKRAWSRVIHGEVQSALSAAVTRLQRAEHLEPYEIEMIKQDLQRAKENLTNPPSQDLSFTRAFSEIVLSWRSICNIESQVSARAQRALDQNQDTRMVTNEIIKEAVSNAVRHGQAKTVTVKLDRIKDDILEIEIQNDGFVPLRNRKDGLGSQMMNELTLSWSLETKNNKTTLKAEVPISKN